MRPRLAQQGRGDDPCCRPERSEGPVRAGPSLRSGRQPALRLECKNGELALVRMTWDESVRRFVAERPKCVNERLVGQQ